MAVTYVTSNAPNVTVCYLDALVMRGVWNLRLHEYPHRPGLSATRRARNTEQPARQSIAPHSAYKLVVRETEFMSRRSGHHTVPVILRCALVIDTGAKTEGLDL
jgi:hypothetical protein